jgi:hypothetical protein
VQEVVVGALVKVLNQLGSVAWREDPLMRGTMGWKDRVLVELTPVVGLAEV